MSYQRKKNKVLILANFGMGLYKFRKELIEELVNKNYEVVASFPKDDYAKLIKELGCTYIETDVDRRGTNPLTDSKLLFHYIKLIKDIKPDVVLTYTVKPNIYGGIAAKVNKVPYIANITGLGSGFEDKGLLSNTILNLYRYSLSNVDALFFQNEKNLQFFTEKKIVVENKSRLIPGSGVNTKDHIFEEYPSKENSIKFIFIGRIMKSKGINELIEAIKLIKPRYPDVTFDIIGFSEENYTEELERLTELGLLNFLGEQEKIHEFIKNSHAIIQPSYHEGLSNVLLETASTGRPVLASNIPGCIETFNEGITGLSFEARNVDSLVNTITNFIELPYEEKKRMGLLGRKKIEEEFDRRIVVEAYMKEIEEITGGN